ncbi:epidermal growth factor receptor substrate 15-like 1 isoform X1 [Haliotis rufescens]|uniref:epidermal growth factor receptor substrate 15-like 1 isoform X1 n=1 Tax=Haliotis rufescens TaxID=6454 RepID=UPI00201EF273|nr:epidermal growth factor receptor substrate 15-like 1 isoform X1 [Haliotis rufescens]
MAAVPPLAQIVGSHIGVYEGYYHQADPKGTGSVGALDAAIFLKKSKLTDTILSQVWDLSDPTGKGYLEKSGFFIALKLIALVQNGQDLSISKITVDTPPPNLGPVEPVLVESPTHSAWVVKPSEKSKYDQVFDSLGPVNGLLSGDKVKPVLLNSKLPTDVLGRIWDLSDIDKDGYLDKDEFAVTMHLVYRARENDPTPTVIPPALIPPSKRKSGSTLPGAVPVMPGIPGVETGRATPPQKDGPGAGGKPWVVTAAEKANADVMFMKLDTDMDGFVTGAEVRSILVQSNLPNPLLAHIWNLSDINGVGKLNTEQFALSMYLVQQKLKGVEPPTTLTPEMIPPSLRPKTGADPAAFGVMDGTNAGPYSHVADFSAIKELDFISKEIDEIKREKMQIERDKVQRDADIKIRQGEVQMLQKELDAMTSTLHQLEGQKKEAQKRLDELGDKRSDLENNVKDLREKCQTEQTEVDKLRGQISNQEKSVKDQESDLGRLRVELNKLREDESSLEQQVEAGKQQLESLVKSQKDLDLQVNQTSARVTHLRDQRRAVAQSIAGYSSQLNGDVAGYGDSDQFSTRTTIGSSPVSTLSGFSVGSTTDDFKEDPFKGKDPFSNSGDPPSQADPFQNDDPFKDSDPFKSSDGFQADPFAAEDPFKDTFGSKPASKSDPFGSEDPFAGSFSPSHSSQKQQSNLDPFGATSSSKQKGGSDDIFGTDPFAPKSSKRTDSPGQAPALPPKSKKQPPPRPAPPKSKSPLPTGANKPKVDPFPGFGSDPFANATDPFASSGTGGGTAGDPFANFADFSPGKNYIWEKSFYFTVDDDAWENKTAEERTIQIGGGDGQQQPVPKSRTKLDSKFKLSSQVDSETDV